MSDTNQVNLFSITSKMTTSAITNHSEWMFVVRISLLQNSYNILRNSKDIDIIKIDSLDNNLRKIFAIKREFLSFFKGEKFDETYNINVSKNYANQINSQISKQNKHLDKRFIFYNLW